MSTTENIRLIARTPFFKCVASAGKGLTSWLLFVMSNCDFITFPCGILGQVWYLIVLIPDICHLSYFLSKLKEFFSLENRVQFYKITKRNLETRFNLFWASHLEQFTRLFKNAGSFLDC